MNMRNFLAGLVLTTVLSGELARAQKCDAPASGAGTVIGSAELTKPVLKAIQDIEERVVAVAEDFPDDLYNTYRPKGDPYVRTAAEVLLHIAEQNYSAAQLIRTKAQQEAWIASGKKRSAKEILTYVSKHDTVEKVKGSFAAVREAIDGNPNPTGSANNSETNVELWLYVIAHSNGHFGNLVTYYRNNGLVPPTSRQ